MIEEDDDTTPDCPRGCRSWEECDEGRAAAAGPDCSARNGVGTGERHGAGICATGRCIEPCGEHGGCAR